MKLLLVCTWLCWSCTSWASGWWCGCRASRTAAGGPRPSGNTSLSLQRWSSEGSARSEESGRAYKCLTYWLSNKVIRQKANQQVRIWLKIGWKGVIFLFGKKCSSLMQIMSYRKRCHFCVGLEGGYLIKSNDLAEWRWSRDQWSLVDGVPMALSIIMVLDN